jgi:hypothetical protein
MMVDARALFLSNTAEERVEALDIISDPLEFCQQRRDIAKFRSHSHRAVIQVYDEPGNVIETHEHGGEFKEP